MASAMSPSSGNAATGQDMPIRRTPPGTKRLKVVLSFLCYLLLGVPVWWHTTSLHRPDLSHDVIEATLKEVQSAQLLLPLRLHIYVVGDDGAIGSPQLWLQQLGEQLQQVDDWRQHLQQGTLQLQATFESSVSGSCTPLSLNPDGDSSSSSSSPRCLGLHAALSSGSQVADTDLDELLHQQLQQQQKAVGDATSSTAGTLQTGSAQLPPVISTTPGQYTLFVLHGRTARGGPSKQAVVGVYRHAWVRYSPGSTADSMQSTAVEAVEQLLSSCWAAHLQQPTAGAAIQSSSSSSRGDGNDVAMPPSGELLLSFSLLNAGPFASTFDWRFDWFDQQYLAPLQQMLSPVAAVSVETQVLFYTQAKVNGSWSESHGSWVISSKDLPFFVDSDWPVETSGFAPAAGGSNLSITSSSRSHSSGAAAGHGAAAASSSSSSSPLSGSAAVVPPQVLHFLVYVPPPEQQPLLLLDSHGQPAAGNAMWVPSWGGLLVLNPEQRQQQQQQDEQAVPHTSAGSSRERQTRPSEGIDDSAQAQQQQQADSAAGGDSSNLGSMSGAAAGGGSVSWPRPVQQLSDQQLQQVASSVVGLLQALLGLQQQPCGTTSTTTAGSCAASSSSDGSMPVTALVPQRWGLAGWQVDALVVRGVVGQVAGAARVLGSLSRLVQELPNLEMPDVIGDQVAVSLAAIQTALAAIQSGSYLAAAAAARSARAAAESAFLHPAVLAQLNFPESHKLGVYMPLFLPLCVPVLKALMGEVKRYKAQRKAWAQQQQEQQQQQQQQS